MSKFRLSGNGSQVAVLVVAICFGVYGTAALEQFMSGAIPVQQPDNVILYNSVMPVVYKFKLPTWDSISMKIQFWSKHNNCTETDNYEDGYPCPILFHMNYLIEHFANNMTSWKNLLREQKLGKDSTDFLHDPSVLWRPSVCSDLGIESHFKASEVPSSQLNRYVDVMSQCAEKNGTVFNVKFVNMSDVASWLESKYHYTFMSFTSDYWKRLTEAAQEATALVAWNTLESGLMVHQFMESNKFVEAVQTCSSKKIPWTLIDASSLKKLLQNMKSRYLEDSQDFAIPLDSISRYFQLPLTDCIFGDDNTLVVRILVPLIPNEAASRNHFVKFHPIPFVTGGKVCSLWNGKESTPFNPGFNGILPCSCANSDTFCNAWNDDTQSTCSASQNLQEKCLKAIASDLEQEIIESCPMTCRSVNPSQADQLHFVLEKNASDTVKILPGIWSEEKNRAAFVECPGKKMPLPLQPVGAYQISLPANCNVINSDSYLSSNETSANIERVSIRHLMPYHWRNGISVDVESEEGSVSFLESVEQLEAVNPKINLLASKLQALDQEAKKDLSDTFLWLLVLCSLMMNAGLVVVVVHLWNWKKEQIFKANRLVYNVAADDFPISGDQQTRPLCDADTL